MRFRAITVSAALLALPLGLALAHTPVAGTSPADGSVLARSPRVIEINFREAAHLTSAVVLDQAKSERKLAFTPAGSAISFKLANPQLERGRNEIRWKALSRDGHVISGSLVIVIEPAASATH